MPSHTSGVEWEERLREIEGLARVTASEIALAASEALEGWIAASGETDPRAFVDSLDRAIRSLLERKPTSAPLLNLHHRAMQFAEEMIRAGVPLPQLREELGDWLRGYRAHIATSRARIAHFAAEVLADAQVILTISNSQTVRAVVEELWQHNPDLSVVVLESRPLLDGRRLARALAERGINTTLTVDGAMAYYMDVASAVLTGAEAVSLSGFFVNTIGTRPLLLVAQAQGVPCYVATQTIKILPPILREGIPTVLGSVADLVQEWSPPEGLELSPILFEQVPDHLVTAYVTEEGVSSPLRLATVARPLGI